MLIEPAYKPVELRADVLSWCSDCGERKPDCWLYNKFIDRYSYESHPWDGSYRLCKDCADRYPPRDSIMVVGIGKNPTEWGCDLPDGSLREFHLKGTIDEALKYAEAMWDSGKWKREE